MFLAKSLSAVIADQPTRLVIRHLKRAGLRPTATRGSRTKWQKGATNLAREVQEDSQGHRGDTMTDQIQAEVHRQGACRVAGIPSLDRATQARTISSVEEAVREVASLVTGKPIDTFHVAMDIREEGVPSSRSVPQRSSAPENGRRNSTGRHRTPPVSSPSSSRPPASRCGTQPSFSGCRINPSTNSPNDNTAASPETGRRRRR